MYNEELHNLQSRYYDWQINEVAMGGACSTYTYVFRMHLTYGWSL